QNVSDETSMSVPTNVKCPTCKKSGDWFATPFGPFCCKRCKLVDLGKWFEEENKISEPLRPEHFQQFEELPPDKNPDEP
ncbi:MAG TPA: DNA gyrase inhibitor YacG, partial [Candidatus Limnocylindria bacterium]|nr:DNA gyrase inhibitor YacG [Candidatus Limnocylindria bacterium]